MKWILSSVFVVGVAFYGMAAKLTAGPVSTIGNDPAILQADHSLEKALGDTDKTAAKATVDKLLDADFTWTDAAGNTRSRAQILQSVDDGSAPAFADASRGAAVKIISFAYGQVGIVQANADKMHALRVWVKRPAGWRALVYQEVRSLDAPPAAPPPGMDKPCDNPCKSLPYQPKNEAEKGVLASYMGLESAALAHNAADWSTHVADEFEAASSNSNELLDKRTRIKGLENEKMAGVAPTALVTARMFDFGDTVVMTSDHKPERGHLLHITRVWVLRGGKWVETLSYQTAIQASPAGTPK